MTKLVLSIQNNNGEAEIAVSTQQVGVPDFKEWSLSQYFRKYLLDEVNRIKETKPDSATEAPMPNELKACPYCNGEYVNSPDGHYVHPFNDCDDRGRILQVGDIVWFNHRPLEDALQKRIAELEKEVERLKRAKC